MTGALILDKPAGISSHDAVLRVRRLLSEPRIGHLGTLDPFATGVLVLLVGKATRLARFYRDRDKTYEGVIRFGYSTDSYDCTGRRTSAEQTPVVHAEEVRQLFSGWIGTHLQQPPPLSAKKISGTPAYRLARKGLEPQLKAVPVTIHELDLLSVAGSSVRFRTCVCSGTYIRSLAHDLGQQSGTGAHLSELRRTAVGEFPEAAAIAFAELEDKVRQNVVPLIPAENLLPEFPAFSLPVPALRSTSHGNSVTVGCASQWVRLLDESGKLVAVAEHIGDNLYHPVVVLNTEAG